MVLLLACTLPADVDPAVPDSSGESASSAVRDFSVGAFHHCWLDGEGSLSCETVGPYAMIGEERARPDEAFVDVEVAFRHGCARTSAGVATCWGDSAFRGTFDTLEVGATSSCGLLGTRLECEAVGWQDDHVPALAEGVDQVSSGLRNTCVLDADGMALCWGGVDLGQGSPGTGPFSAISVGHYTTCTLADEVVDCVGDDLYGLVSEAPEELISISVGVVSACGRTAQSEISCWGSDIYGVISGVPSGTFARVEVGAGHACALSYEDELVCWGGSLDEQWDHSGAPLSHERDIQPIWDMHCLACHPGTGGSDPRLNLARGSAYGVLMGETWHPGLVNTSSVSDSRVLVRLKSQSAPMPPTHTLPSTQIDLVARWIEEGAAP